MKKYGYMILMAAGALLAGCQDKDVEIAAPILSPISAEELKGELVDNDYVWTWTPREGKTVQVNVIKDGQIFTTETLSLIHI